MKPEPVVSGVIPVQDGEAYLGDAIESMLGQSRRPDQIVVVDNGSTDRTAEVARSFGTAVEIVETPRGAVGRARNAGVAAAVGTHIGFLDHDDTWEPGKVETQLAAMGADPGLDFVFGHAVQVLEPGIDAALASRLRIDGAPQPGLHLGAMLATRRAFEQVGPFTDEVRASDGLEWIAAARDLGLRERMLDDVVLTRRIHGANTSLTNKDGRSEWARVLKASLDRRRRAGSA